MQRSKKLLVHVFIIKTLQNKIIIIFINILTFLDILIF